MTKISMGRRTFDGIPFDTNLQFKIIDGTRPECTHAPEFYVRLANSCMDHDPDKRPTAMMIANIVGYWFGEMNRVDSEIQNQIFEADKIKPEPVKPKYLIYYYSSKLINTNPDDTTTPETETRNDNTNSHSTPKMTTPRAATSKQQNQ
ncbi:hypothetical protein C2G38_2192582 [Gigaspora rosea]|uniref:Serine-threonine/tyrosine-protein kinase catalytic domain-containing protein n=1 Tax=Gigaspora rosea TaxID=44941 RepID=A0A397V2W4_9GLOM|nr:hypothetical protein C2G38_2192582 [Gigaspora rosea]